MATLHIKDDTYQRLAQQAAAQNTTVDAYVAPVLEKLAEVPPAQAEGLEPTPDERQKAFDRWMARVQERADRYPPGFIVDDSRESIYEGRGE